MEIEFFSLHKWLHVCSKHHTVATSTILNEVTAVAYHSASPDLEIVADRRGFNGIAICDWFSSLALCST